MEILTHPHPILTSIAEQVKSFEGLDSVIAEMITIAKQNDLVGLAGNQVGLLKRIFIIDVSTDEQKQDFKACLNPVIKPIFNYGKSLAREGCGSLPGLVCLVERHNRIKLNALDQNGNPFQMILQDFQARIAQHENDHLNGILITSKAIDVKYSAELEQIKE